MAQALLSTLHKSEQNLFLFGIAVFPDHTHLLFLIDCYQINQ